jgi:DNA-directed RNA polymerase specialized sigma24 family protein
LMDDPELLVATVEGDAEAFAAFYRRHLSLVVAFCLRSTGDREVAADLASEVFAAALSSAQRFNPASGSAEAWLIGIAQNKLRESQRRGRVQDAIRRKLIWRVVCQGGRHEFPAFAGWGWRNVVGWVGGGPAG